MADQDWKDRPLNRQKYIIHKPCQDCKGNGKEGGYATVSICTACSGRGMIPVASDAAYFVLRIDCDPDTGEPHDPHARQALVEYADLVSEENVEYATGIVVWLQELKSAEP